MAREINRLSARFVQTEAKAGYYADGEGLYLQVSKFGTKSWVYRYTLNKKREMGLGSVNTVSLKKAREYASECREMINKGIDPIAYRKTQRAEFAKDASKLKSFKECAEIFINNNSSAWSNIKHAKQWESTLKAYAYPVFGSLPVSVIETHHIMKALSPIWSEKNETAKRVRGRIEAVLDSAKVQDLREGENPARWKGHLDKLLPKPSKIMRVKHHAALPYTEIGEFMTNLRKSEGVAARGLEFLILTAARTSEVLNTTFDEIDFDNNTWVIPVDRMKAGKEHRVPLSPKARQIAYEMQEVQQNDYLFPGQGAQRGLSNMAFLKLLQRMKYEDITVHGFRSSFRDWAAEQTAYPSDVVEMALAHSVGNQVQQAYHRTDLFEKRRRLMNDWERYCDQTRVKGGVVAMRSRS